MDLKVYKWSANFDNGATIERKTGIAFASDDFHVPYIINNILCKHNEDSVSRVQYERINVIGGDAFVVVDEWKNPR